MSAYEADAHKFAHLLVDDELGKRAREQSPAERLVGELARALGSCAEALEAFGIQGGALDETGGLLARAAAFHDHAPELADALRNLSHLKLPRVRLPTKAR